MSRRRASQVRWRRSSHLVAYWRGDILVFHNYATNVAAEATPLVCGLLDVCAGWRSAGEIHAHLRDAAPSVVDALVRRLVSLTFLQRSDRAQDPRERAMDALDRWNPAAGFFHTATKNVRFLPASAATRVMAAQARTWPMPSPVKRLPGAPRVTLPAVRKDGQFPAVLLARRTWRRFSTAPVSREELSTLLGLSCGVQQWVDAVPRRAPLKTSPSGGARHPIECYVVALRVDGVRPGTYHYAADAHVLERVSARSSPADIARYFPHSQYFAKAAAVVLFTAVFERQIWRYPYARAYRAALAEAGHVCQTFCLTATWLGLAPFALMGLADSTIERDLGIDGVGESVVYAAGVGRPPRGTRWAPLARGRARARPNPAFA